MGYVMPALTICAMVALVASIRPEVLTPGRLALRAYLGRHLEPDLLRRAELLALDRLPTEADLLSLQDDHRAAPGEESPARSFRREVDHLILAVRLADLPDPE